MTNEPHVDLDQQLRDVFVLEPEAVARVADRALEETPCRRPGRRALVGFGVTAVVALLAGAVAVRMSRPPGTEPARAAETLETPSEPDLIGFLTGGALIVPVSDDDIVIVGPGDRGERPPDGFGIVLVEGELR